MPKYLFILLKFIQITRSLVVFDVDDGGTVVFGNAIVDVYLKTLDVFYKVYGDIKYCDFDFWRYYTNYAYCDLEIYSRSCIMKQNLIGKRVRNDYIGFEKRTFSCTNARKITEEYKNIIELNCGPIAHATFDQMNEIYLPMSNLHFLSRVDGPYSNIIQFTTYAGDGDFKGNGYFESYGIYNTYVEAFYTIIQRVVPFRVTTYLKVFKSVMLEEYIVKVQCSNNYFGDTCWFSCRDTVRMQCNCQYSMYYVNVPCDPKCTDGWMGKYVKYDVINKTETAISCDTMNICKNPEFPFTVVCNPPKLCLPVSNTTYYCELIYASFMSDKTNTNISSKTFFYGESFVVNVDKTLLQNQDVGINTTVLLVNGSELFTNSVITMVLNEETFAFNVIDLVNIDIEFTMILQLNLKAWEFYIERLRIFRIYVPPREIKIYHHDNLTEINFYIFLGEYIIVDSKAMPKHRTFSFWTSKYLNTPLVMNDKLHIDIYNNLGFMHLSCNSTLISTDRENPSISKEFLIIIKPFQFFEWNNSENVFEHGTVIKCQAKAYYDFNLEIIQLHGYSTLSVSFDTIVLENIQGGTYELICYFMTDIGLQYSSYILFKLRVNPTKICLFPYANIFGSIVQCGHNGFIQDEYDININLYIFDGSEWQIVLEKEKYLRIPYHLKANKYRIICSIIDIFDKKIKISHTVSGEIFTSLKETYTITSLNKMCLLYENYIEPPKIIELQDSSMTIEHYLLFLNPHELAIYLQLLLCSLFLNIPIIVIFLIIYQRFRMTKKIVILQNYISSMVKRKKLRNLDDRLLFEVIKSSQLRNRNIDLFFKTPFDSKSSSLKEPVKMLKPF